MSSRDRDFERAVLDLLDQAYEQPSGARVPYVEGREDLDAEVRQEALDILESQSEVSEGLQTGGAKLEAEEGEIPERIGPYRILRLIGRGGMGDVFLADRASDDFDQIVAIKLIKAGIMSDRLIERFRRERQLLAQLRHKNIAHLYDGGETESGAPFIIMEYVDGQSLTAWAKSAEPTLEKRLRLFLQVCDAVAFAHQNLIIHRDLTPSNILVTELEEAKLIDFGIAKPQSEEAEEAQASAFSALSLTPGFAAPERAQGVSANTLADVFSLGKILEFLAKPFQDRELQAIVAKASAEDPSERYPSVADLQDDLTNHQNGHPVGAFSNARTYHWRKFALRERGLVASLAGVLLALAAGLGATAWAYNRSEAARELSDLRFSQVRDLANFQLFELYDMLDQVVGNTGARVEMAAKAQAYLNELAQSRSSNLNLQLETANGFVKLAQIQGVPGHPNFGESDQAKANLDQAIGILNGLQEQGHTAATPSLALAHAYKSLIFAHSDSKPAEAWKAAERSKKALDQTAREARGTAWYEAQRKYRLAVLEWADLELDSDKLTEFSTALASDTEAWPEPMRGGLAERFDRTLAGYYQAIVQYNVGEPAELERAVQGYLEADDGYAAIEADYPNEPMVLYWRAWNAYYGYAAAATLESDDRAERLLVQARQSVTQLIAVEGNDQSLRTFSERLLEAQAEFYSNLGRHAEAVAAQAGVIEGRKAKITPERKPRSISDLAYGQAIFGSILARAGNRSEACANWKEADALMEELKQQDALSAYVEDLQSGVRANIDRCDRGAPTSAFGPLTS